MTEKPQRASTSKDKQKKDPIEEAMSWANKHLSKKGRSAADISHDFCDGTNLLVLIEIITKKPIAVPWCRTPTSVHEKRKNIGACLSILTNNRYLKPGIVRPDDILWGELNPTYAVLRALNIYMDNGHLPYLPITRDQRTTRNSSEDQTPEDSPENSQNISSQNNKSKNSNQNESKNSAQNESKNSTQNDSKNNTKNSTSQKTSQSKSHGHSHRKGGQQNGNDDDDDENNEESINKNKQNGDKNNENKSHHGGKDKNNHSKSKELEEENAKKKELDEENDGNFDDENGENYSNTEQNNGFAGTADFSETLKSLRNSGDLSKSQELHFSTNECTDDENNNDNNNNKNKLNDVLDGIGDGLLNGSAKGSRSGSRISQNGGNSATNSASNTMKSSTAGGGGGGGSRSASRTGSKLGDNDNNENANGSKSATNKEHLSGDAGSRTGSRLSQKDGKSATGGDNGSVNNNKSNNNNEDVGEDGKASSMINTMGNSLLGDPNDAASTGKASGTGSRSGSRAGKSGELNGTGSRSASRSGKAADGNDSNNENGKGATGSRPGSRSAGGNGEKDSQENEGQGSEMMKKKGNSLLGGEDDKNDNTNGNDSSKGGKDGKGDQLNKTGNSLLGENQNQNNETELLNKTGKSSKSATGGENGNDDDEENGAKSKSRNLGNENDINDENEIENGDEEQSHVKHSRYAMGIDLGTTFCRYGVFHDDNIDTNGLDNILQSAVVFDGDNKIVGVVPMSLEDDENAVIVTDIKRIIGRDFTDPTLPLFLESLPYNVVEDPETHRPAVEVPINGEKQTFSAEQLTAMLLSHVKELVSSQMGEEVTDAVISVPAFFTQAQRKATMDAGKIAGLNVIRIINEPAAAAVAFNARHKAEHESNQNESNEGDEGDEEESKNIIVYDIGGGKLDVSVMAIDGGDMTTVKTAGNTNLGGIDFDNKLVQLILKDFKDKTGLDAKKSPLAMRRLKVEAERLKIKLSEQEEADLHITKFYGDKDLDFHITREEFEKYCDDLFKMCIEPIDDIFMDNEIDKDQIREVLLVGGSTRIPRLRRDLRKYFGDDIEFFDADQDEAVVEGAAMQGAIMKGQKDAKLKGVMIHGSVPLSLGISCANGKNMIIIPRGTTLPVKRFTQATTIRDKQRNVGFDIVEGERPMAADNIKLGHVTVSGIQIAKRGVPKIEVAMNITEDGILVVTGRDLMTHVAVTASVENKGTLPHQAVRKMIIQAEKEKFNDDLKMKRAERKTELVYFLERAENTYDDANKTKKLKPADKAQFKKYVDEYKSWLEKHPDEIPSAYQRKYNTLYFALNKILPVK